MNEQIDQLDFDVVGSYILLKSYILHFQIKNLIEHDPTLTPAVRDARIAGIPARIDSMMAADPWMKFFLTYDPAATLRRVKTPVLILTGANDQQAAPAQVALEAAAFKEGGNKD